MEPVIDGDRMIGLGAADDKGLLGRLERPDDIAGAVAFLCSSAADHVTGSHLIVSGGLPYHK